MVLFYLSSTSALDGVSWSMSEPGRFNPGKEPFKLYTSSDAVNYTWRHYFLHSFMSCWGKSFCANTTQQFKLLYLTKLIVENTVFWNVVLCCTDWYKFFSVWRIIAKDTTATLAKFLCCYTNLAYQVQVADLSPYRASQTVLLLWETVMTLRERNLR